MKSVLLISPHFDDAVLSAGQFMAGRPDCEVVTVFAGEPFQGERIRTPYDKKCGFDNAKDAIAMRRYEDDLALSLLNATPIHLDFVDSQYGAQLDEDELFKQLNEIATRKYEFILAPMGLKHPDHEAVARVVKRLDFPREKYYWEDLPVRVVEPELVPPRLREMGLTERVSIGDGPIANKIRSLSCYKSQIGTGILDPFLMYVPERFWK